MYFWNVVLTGMWWHDIFLPKIPPNRKRKPLNEKIEAYFCGDSCSLPSPLGLWGGKGSKGKGKGRGKRGKFREVEEGQVPEEFEESEEREVEQEEVDPSCNPKEGENLMCVGLHQ